MSRRFLLIWSALLFLTLLPASAKMDANSVDKLVKEHALTEVSLDYVASKIGDGTRGNGSAIILDARPIPKYNQAHIPSALPMPDNKIEENMHWLKDVPKNREIITYCGGLACGKGAKVAIALKAKGYTDLKVLREGLPGWQKSNRYVDIELDRAKQIFDDQKAIFIDARPFPKFAQATIIGSLSIPDNKLKQRLGWLPTDTRTPVITFCGGYACHKSHAIAKTMEMMGYRNVMTLSAGLPGWKKAGYPTTASGGGVATSSTSGPKTVGPITLGKSEGTVDVDWFNAMLSKKPGNLTIVDIRAAEDYAKGHIPGSISIPKNKANYEQFLPKIPKEGYVILTCATGTSSMEFWLEMKENRHPRLNEVYFLDAEVKCDSSNQCVITGFDLDI